MSAEFVIRMDNRFPAFNAKLITLLSNGIQSGLWPRYVAPWLSAITRKMFLSWGGDYGREKWPAIKPDLWGTPKRGIMGGLFGVYGPQSNPLIASGTYMRSFKTLSQSPRRLSWGSGLKKPKSKGGAEARSWMPYRGWKDNPKGPVVKYVQRYALPDPASQKFQREFRRQVEIWKTACFRDAIRAARSAGEAFT